MESVPVSVPNRDEQPKNGSHEMSVNSFEDVASGTNAPSAGMSNEIRRSSNETTTNPFLRLPDVVLNRYVYPQDALTTHVLV